MVPATVDSVLANRLFLMRYCAVDGEEGDVLDTASLLTIAQRIRRDYAPRFVSPHAATATEWHLSAQQLLAVSETVRRHYAPQATPSTAQLQLLAIAPNTLQVYWQAPTEALAQSCVLRVFPQSKPAQALEAEQVFAFKLPSACGQQVVVLPSEQVVSQCHAQLVADAESSQVEWVVHSNTIQLPLATFSAGGDAVSSSPGWPFAGAESVADTVGL